MATYINKTLQASGGRQVTLTSADDLGFTLAAFRLMGTGDANKLTWFGGSTNTLQALDAVEFQFGTGGGDADGDWRMYGGADGHFYIKDADGTNQMLKLDSGGDITIGRSTKDLLVPADINVGSGKFTVDAATGDITVAGNLTVSGTTFVVNTEEVLVEDNALYLNAGYTSTSAMKGGLVLNYLPTSTVDTVAATGFVAGVGLYATGTATMASVLAGHTFSVKTVAFTAVNGGAVPANQTFDMSGTDIQTAASLVAAINDAASQALISAVATTGVVCAAANGGTAIVTLTASVVGNTGNFALAQTGGTISLSGATMTQASTNPTVSTTGGATFSATDLIQITGATNAANNGLFEVLSHAANVLTIRGVGATANVLMVTQDQFVTDTTVAGSICKVNVSIIQANTDGNWEVGKGSSNAISFAELGTSGALTLDGAYNGGHSITVDDGAVSLVQSKTTETTGTLAVTYAASAFTGTPHGIVVDMSTATSVTNGSDVYGMSLKGKANAGAGTTIGLYVDSGWDGAGIQLIDDQKIAFGTTLSTAPTLYYDTSAGNKLILAGGSTSEEILVQTNNNTSSITLDAMTNSGTGTLTLKGTTINMSAGDDDSGALNIFTTADGGAATSVASIAIYTGLGQNAVNSGAVSMYTGTAAATTGAVDIYTGDSSAVGLSGAISIKTGTTTNNASGGVSIYSGAASGGNSGDVAIYTGNSVGGTRGTVNIDGGAVTIDATLASNFTVAGADLTLSTTTTGAVTVTSAGVMDLDAADALSINSSGGAINIGNDAVAQAIGIGTGAAARTITIGNNTASSAVVVEIPDNQLNAFSVKNLATRFFTVSTSDGAEALSYGGVGFTHTFAIGDNKATAFTVNEGVTTYIKVDTSDGAEVVTVGSTTAAAATTIQTGTGAMTFTAGGIFDVNATGAVTIDGTGISIDGTSASNVTVTGANLTLSTVTSGNLILTSADLMDVNAGANLDIDVTGTFDMLSSGAFSIDGTGASNVSATSGNLTLSTITTGSLLLTSAGVSTYTVPAAQAASLTITDGAANYIVVDTTAALKQVEMVQFTEMAASLGAGAQFYENSACIVGSVVYAVYDGGADARTEVAPADSDGGTILANVFGVVVARTDTGGGVYLDQISTVAGSKVPVKFAAAPATGDNGKIVFLSAANPGYGTLTAPDSSGCDVWALGVLVGGNGASTTPSVVWNPQFRYNIA